MFEPRRIEMNVKPQTFEKLGNGTYYYNYDITPKTVVVDDMETGEAKTEQRWDFVQVHLRGIPEYRKCVEAVIREHIDINEEFDLINSMNKLSMGLSVDEEARDEYTQYLQLISTIKTNVKADFV